MTPTMTPHDARYYITSHPHQVLFKSCKPVPVMAFGVLLGKKYPLKKYVIAPLPSYITMCTKMLHCSCPLVTAARCALPCQPLTYTTLDP